MSSVSDEDLHLGTLPDDPNGVADCGDCNGHAVVGGTVCPSCRQRQQLRNAWWESSPGSGRLSNWIRGL